MEFSGKRSKFEEGDLIIFNDEIFPYTVTDISIVGNKLEFEFLYTLTTDDCFSFQTTKENLMRKAE